MIHADRRRIAARVSIPSVFTALAGWTRSGQGRSSGYSGLAKSVRFPCSRSIEEIAENVLHERGKLAGEPSVGSCVLPEVEEIVGPFLRTLRRVGAPGLDEELELAKRRKPPTAVDDRGRGLRCLDRLGSRLRRRRFGGPSFRGLERGAGVCFEVGRRPLSLPDLAGAFRELALPLCDQLDPFLPR